MYNDTYRPILRPVEVFTLPDGDSSQVGVRDRSQLSDVVLTLSRPALHILSMMDGTCTCEEMRRKFQAAHGQGLEGEILRSMVDALEDAHFLEGPKFESYVQSLQEDYRASGVRSMSHAHALGVEDASGTLFDSILAEATPEIVNGKIRGIVAPHLDYARGRPCYAVAYGVLRARDCPQRVVILGTNHFGRSASVVATGNDFETPLGRTRVDIDFLEVLEGKCGDLRTHELDHLHEHSVELQVLWLQHLFGSDAFTMVPFLCPDIFGPSETAPADANGVTLRVFVSALTECIAEDDGDTLLVAGADLSHIGAAFGDDRPLDKTYLEEVRRYDLLALDRLQSDGADGFRKVIIAAGNRTNICSTGCISALAEVLSDAKSIRLGYHQAVDQATQTCVTCTAQVYT